MHKQIMRDVLALADLYRPTWAGISAAIERSGVPTCEVKTGSLRDDLKEVESTLASLRDERKTLASERDAAREAYSSAEDKSSDSQAFKDAEAAVRALGEKDDEIGEYQKRQVGLLRMLGEETSASKPAGDPSDPRSQSWDSSCLFSSEDVRRTLEHASHTKGRIGGVELGQVISRDALAAEVALSPDQRRAAWIGVLPQLRRMLRILDLIPTGTMDNNVLPYTQESGSFDTAAETSEAGTKPEAAVTFTDETAEAQTIAHWIKIRKQSLADFAALRSIIDSRLRYGVERRLENQILAGNGTAPNLKGILKTSGISVVKYAANEVPMDVVLKGITSVLLNEGQATGIAVHPLMWEEILKAKAKFGTEGGSGEYYGGGPFAVTAQTLWGVPLVASKALPEGEALVADFEIGVQLFIREGVNVLMSDSDQDDFIKNRVTMLAEMRAALAVFRPSVIAKCYLTKAAEEAGI